MNNYEHHAECVECDRLSDEIVKRHSGTYLHKLSLYIQYAYWAGLLHKI